MTTIQDIADRLHIAKGTVSKALNDAPDVSEALKTTVFEMAVEMGYTKLKIRKDEAKTLCIMVENMAYENKGDFGYDIILGFRQMAGRNGYEVETVPLSKESQEALSFDAFMLKNKFMGAFLLGYTIHDPWYPQFRTSKTPAVLFDNYIPSNPHVAFVGADSQDGLNQAVSYLREQGHTCLGYLSTGTDSFYTRSRYQGFLTAMEKHGLPLLEEGIGIRNPVKALLDEDLPRVLHAGATALVCAYDEIAIGAMERCRQMGLRVPEDVSIIGFDDIPQAENTDPGLTTIRQDLIQLGKCGYYALDSLINQVPISTVLLHGELILRSSAGRCP